MFLKRIFFARFLETRGAFVPPQLSQIRRWSNDPNIKKISSYKTGAEYLEKNPDCCSYGPQKGVTAESARYPRFYQRFLGSVWGLVAVRYNVPYVNGADQIKQFQSFTQGWVNPCGYSVWDY